MAHIITDIPDHNIPLNEEGAKTFLRAHSFPEGFITAFIKNAERVPIRYIVCDDSGSMAEGDGKRLLRTKAGALKQVACSRWDELRDSLSFHAELASASNSLTEFRFLNGPPSIVVGDFERDPDRCGLREMKKVLEGGPAGGTPLCAHIRAIIRQLQQSEARLRQANQVACVTICTDGVCSDGDLVQAMKPLEKLPCWVVLKLCTDDSTIVSYWSGIDSQLEIEMDVLDDFFSESAEVHEVNPWIVYSLELHRLREWGLKHVKEADILDEKRLTHSQMVALIAVLFNIKPSDLPNPQADPREFKRAVKQRLLGLPPTYDPVTDRVVPWVNYASIKYCYGLPGGGCSIS